MKPTPIARLGLLGLTIALSACSALESDKINYKSATKAASLEVPPDLQQLARDSRYATPGGVVSANALQTQQTAQPVGPTTAINSLGDVRVERDGSQRWLVVKRPAEQLWEPVRDFWQENGFVLVQDDAKVGIMETDWAENRAKLPQDFIRSALGKILDSVYSTGERDKFRIRLERNASGGTEIYVTHRGMAEVYSNSSKDATHWQPRPADPELETEFLRRIMVKLGASKEQAQAITANAAPQQQPSARIQTINNSPVLQLNDGFDRAWRRVGLALDRTGFTVEDRDRSQGLYFVRYVPSNTGKPEPGFFGKLFKGDPVIAPEKYRILVSSQGESSSVSVLNASGIAETSASAASMVRVLADELK